MLVEHIGSAWSDPELAILRVKADERMAELRSPLSLLTELEIQSHNQATNTSRRVMSGSFASGLWRVMGGIYDRIGLPDDLLKYLVLARIAVPKRKLTTARYLASNLGCTVSVSAIYKHMDTLGKDKLVAILLGYAQEQQITSWDYEEGGTLETTVDHRRLIVTRSEKRAKRSRLNRELLVKKLTSKLERGQVVKKSKYVILDTAEQPTNNKQPPKFSGHIDQEKLEADAQFDGLKGYITNTGLPATEVIAHYSTLWNVEKSFRMSKSDLRARPTFHYKRERVIAHLVICVCALAVLQEFERKLHTLTTPDRLKPGLSVALEELLAIRAYTLRLTNQQQVTVYSELSKLQEQLLEM